MHLKMGLPCLFGKRPEQSPNKTKEATNWMVAVTGKARDQRSDSQIRLCYKEILFAPEQQYPSWALRSLPLLPWMVASRVAQQGLCFPHGFQAVRPSFSPLQPARHVKCCKVPSKGTSEVPDREPANCKAITKVDCMICTRYIGPEALHPNPR